uniref:Actin-related protein 6 n=1 Tax=Haptolina ericina TaxID=156174 RepID=A0A6T9PHI6_9EUKA
MPNGLAKSKTEHKVFIGDQLETCNDFSSLQYRLSLERGCVVNWDTQAEVWARAFGPEVLRVHPGDCSLLLTEIPMCPPSIQDTIDEMVFEHFGFQSYCTRPAPVLAALAVQHEQSQQSEKPPPCASLVLDAGFSATHAVPIYGSSALNFGIKRLNLGGKALTNHLKQIISFRSYNVMEETYLINDVKERLCYVSLDFTTELALTRFKGKKNTLRREFVMPDYVNHFRGQIRDPNQPAAAPAAAAAPAPAAAATEGGPPKKKQKELVVEEQVLVVSNERISVPELLFRPSDIGIDQAGVGEVLVQAAEATLPDLREVLYSNIVLTGGSTLFPHFEERLRAELRELAPADYSISISRASDPLLAAWKGGSLFASADSYESHVVTKAEYDEHGHSLCRARFLM